MMLVRRAALMAALSTAAGAMTAGGALAAEAGGAAARYRRETLRVGTVAKRTSQIARERARNRLVRLFAANEVDEQNTVAVAITGRENPPVDLTPAEEREIARLRGLSGAAFDRAYVLAQVEGHETLRAIQQRYLREGDNANLLDIARLNLSRIREHLVELGEPRRVVAG